MDLFRFGSLTRSGIKGHKDHENTEAPVTIVERISLWLREVGGAYCDDCIARELKLPRRQQASRATKTLSTTRNFCREKGICSLCGARKNVIEAV
jgi:hypothetical protein